MDLFFAQALNEICEHSAIAPGRPLRCMAVVNPVAGGFAINSKWESNHRILTKYQAKAQEKPRRQIHKNMLCNLTEGKGSAKEITKTYLERIDKDPSPFYLIISAGGDGTHSEVMASVYNALPHVRSNMAVLRLPLGTGNDGADHSNLGNAFDLLLNSTDTEFVPAVQLKTNPEGPTAWKGPFLAFNILSVGLDAYVTHQTNSMKKDKPGNSYQLWLDIASLFYDTKYKVDYANVRALDAQNKETASFREKVLLLAMGASGHRTYGSQQRILPDHRNVCVMKQMSVFRKVAIKGQVSKGKHINSPEAIMLNAHRVEFSMEHPILAQMDGETVLLQPNDFPASMELTAPVIPVLKKN